MAGPLIIGGIAIGVLIIALKEVADFIQIGMVAWQSGVRFKQQKALRNGVVGIDGGMVSIQIGELRANIPLDDAAGLAGVAGAAGRGKRPEIGARAGRPVPPGGWGAVTPSEVETVKREGTHLSRPQPGQDALVAVAAPAVDRRPFTLRDYFTAQQEGAAKGGARKDARERELAALEQAHEFKLGLLEAQIEREKIAAQVDVARMQIVFRLEEQRRDLISKFALQREELINRLQLQAEKAEADLVAQRERFSLQEGLNTAEREWKTVEGARDRKWRADTQRDQSELAQYRLNLNSDLAVGRAVDAAVKLGEALKRHGLAPAGLVSFGQAFAGR